MSIAVNGQGEQVIPCDTQVWILKITDAIGELFESFSAMTY
jgi:hypothetical protein